MPSPFSKPQLPHSPIKLGAPGRAQAQIWKGGGGREWLSKEGRKEGRRRDGPTALRAGGLQRKGGGRGERTENRAAEGGVRQTRARTFPASHKQKGKKKKIEGRGARFAAGRAPCGKRGGGARSLDCSSSCPRGRRRGRARQARSLPPSLRWLVASVRASRAGR